MGQPGARELGQRPPVKQGSAETDGCSLAVLGLAITPLQQPMVTATVAPWVERAAELSAQGWSLQQIGAELGVRWPAVAEQLRRAGVTIVAVLRPTAPPHSKFWSCATRGQTWTGIAGQVWTDCFRVP